MPDEQGDFVEVYRARGLPEAYAIRLLLEDLGVSVRIDNEMLQGALGDLPVGWVTAPRIMVLSDYESISRQILNKFVQQSERNDDGVDSSACCLACGMPMEGADACPSCGWSYKTTDAGESADADTDRAAEDESEYPSNDKEVVETSRPAANGDRQVTLTRRRVCAGNC